MSSKRVAIVVGVGAEAGLGGALCKRFGREGLHVLVAGGTAARLEALVGVIRGAGGEATAVPCDTTVEADVIRVFDAAGGPPEIVVFNAGNNRLGNLAEMEASFFEDTWRVACFGGFLVGREAARRMVPAGRGTVVFTGATGSLRASRRSSRSRRPRPACAPSRRAWRASSVPRVSTWRTSSSTV